MRVYIIGNDGITLCRKAPGGGHGCRIARSRDLCRRSQKARLVWTQMVKPADAFLPKPRVLHPWPSVRFAVRHPR